MSDGASSPSAEQPSQGAEPVYPTQAELAALLPQYEIHEIIGIGGMGAVYKARQISLDRWVAIKVLPSESSQNPEDVQRFIKEARAMAKLVHPHIVAVFDFGQTYARHLFLVMEYIEGCDLHRRTRGGEITRERAREVIAQLCDALQFAHDRGVAHRDIKPANILITNDWKVKVADFGLARDLTTQSNIEEVEYGTPDYTAPERLILGSKVDHRADIYALGVVIHEMLTGQTPTAAGKDASEQLPPGFASIIAKCLKSEPDERYQKAVEVKVALLTATAETALQKPAAAAPKAVHAPQISAEPPSAGSSYRPSPFIRWRQQLAPLGWGAACAILLAGFGWAIFRNKPKPEVNEKPPAVVSVSAKPRLEPPKVVAPQTAPPSPAPVAPPTKPAVAAPPANVAAPSSMAPEKAVAPAAVAPLAPWAVLDGEPAQIAQLQGHRSPCYDVHLFSDQRRAASVGMDGTLRVWYLAEQKELFSAQPGLDALNLLQVSADENQALVLSYTSDKVAMIELATGKVLHSATYPTAKLLNAVLLKDDLGVMLCGSDDEGAPNLFHWQPGSPLKVVSDYVGRNYCMISTPEGTSVLLSASKKTSTGSYQVQWSRFDARTAQLSSLPLQELGYVTRSLGRRGASTVMMISNHPHLVSLTEFKTHLTLPTIPRDGIQLLSAEVVDGGRLLLSSWSDSTLRVQEVDGGAEVWRATTSEPVTDCALSKDERWAVMSTRFKDPKKQQGDYHLLVWRLPRWSTLVSDHTLSKTAASQMPELASHDPELAALRNRLPDEALPGQKDLDTERQKLDTLYVSALRRDYALLSPTEQQAFKAEIERIALQNELPPETADLKLPTSLRKLRGIYRQQLKTLQNAHSEAIKSVRESGQQLILPLIEKRSLAGDRLGAIRAKSVLEEWNARAQ